MAKKNENSKDQEKEQTKKDLINIHIQNAIKLKCKNNSQKEFLKTINEKEITFSYGPAGCGKSLLSLFKGLQLLKARNNSYHYLTVTKPIIDVEESLGYLPGELNEKLRPYVASSVDLIDKLIGKGPRKKLEADGILKFAPLAHIRGANIDNCIFIGEESQNMSPLQMKTLLTRIGESSKFIISGDLDQSDRYKDVKNSGLYDAIQKHGNIDEVGMHEFSKEDIVRNPLITKILENYQR